MERLTNRVEKFIEDKKYIWHTSIVEENGGSEAQIRERDEMLCKVVEKLGQLEDIEEELGVDYKTLNDFRNSELVYDKDEDRYFHIFSVDIKGKRIIYIDKEGETWNLPFATYKRAWALTKEELEK